MIPLRLTLKNFMCYRENVPPLELESIHVACLCGDNGHGKTALLDAITWALWGQARARTQEELVHQGQLDMSVELDFLARGQRYRVSRRHSRSVRSRQGATLLELQLVTENGATPLTGGVMRETQDRISDLIHMDYDTFVNTAFLRQGDADRFTTSTPSQRKETLAEVLDLSYYDVLEERAKVISRSMQLEAAGTDREVAWRKQEIEWRPEHEKKLTGVNATLGRIGSDVDTQRRVVDELRSSVQVLHGRRDELADIHSGLSSKRSDVKLLETQLQGFAARVGDYESAVAQEGKIRQRFSQLQESRAEQERLDKALGHKTELDAENARLEKEIAIQNERLTSQIAQLRTAIADELGPKAGRLGEIESQIAQLTQQEKDLQVRQEGVEKRRAAVREIADRLRDLDAANERLRAEMEDTRKKFDMLEQGDSLCPLCNQALGPDGKEHLRLEYEALGRESRSAYDANSSERDSLARQHGELVATLTLSETELAGSRQHTERRRATLESVRAEAERAKAQLGQASVQLEEAERTFTTKDFAHEERRLLSTVDADLELLQYDAARHGQVREQARAMAPYDELNRKLQEAVERLPLERGSLATAREMLRGRRQEIVDTEQRGAVLQVELGTLDSEEARLRETEKLAAELDEQRSNALREQGVLEQQVRRAVELEQELEVYEGERRRLADERAIYDELSLAFGKNGVQALIIETAIPQLESDSNDVLMRLTENRMTLKLQLVEGRKSRGGARSEELDIRIADEVGTRSYETFSGGEAFRINFAIRIALSKLLARRAGAPLPTLFIDEGFGSQDSTGQERLVEAIQSIQDDFQKIIVITHVEQIKEAFPVRIEVTKTSAGSTFVAV